MLILTTCLNSCHKFFHESAAFYLEARLSAKEMTGGQTGGNITLCQISSAATGRKHSRHFRLMLT